MKQIVALVLWLALSFSAGWFGSHFRPGEWYQSLQKPSWTPPSFLFPLVWPVLYALMGLSTWLVWKKRDENPLVTTALVLFVFQLLLNAAWSWIFFGQRQLGWALLEIVGLWLAILATAVVYYRIHALSGMLLIPYLLWVGFASFLNGAIWLKNTGLPK